MNDSINRKLPPRRQWLTPGTLNGSWLVLVSLIALILLLSMLGETARQALRFDRIAILNERQYWRLLTGHLVHGSWRHTLLNTAGLGLIVALFRGVYTPMQWCRIGLLSALCIDVGLLMLMPTLQWYVGLSGVLHGLLAAGAVAWWRVESPGLAALLTAILVGKLCWEQWQGALPLSGDLPVIVNAHLYGAAGGLLAGALMLTRLPGRSAQRPN